MLSMVTVNVSLISHVTTYSWLNSKTMHTTFHTKTHTMFNKYMGISVTKIKSVKWSRTVIGVYISKWTYSVDDSNTTNNSHPLKAHCCAHHPQNEKTWCEIGHSVVKHQPFESDGWCGMMSKPKPICVCDGFCTITTSATTWHHYPQLPFLQHILSHTCAWLSLTHERCVDECDIDNSWRLHHNTHIHTIQPSIPTLCLIPLSTIREHTTLKQ